MLHGKIRDGRRGRGALSLRSSIPASERHNELRKASGSALVPLLSGLSMAYSQLATAVFGAFLASLLGAEDYGTINLARNILTIAVVLSPLGLDLALQRHLAHAPQERRGAEVAWLRLLAFAISGFVTALLFTRLADLLEVRVFQHEGFGLVLAMTMASLPFATDMAVLGGAYRGVYQPLISVVTTYFLQPTFRIVAILSILALGLAGGLWAVVIGTLVSYVAAWAVQAVRAHIVFPVRGGQLRAALPEAGLVLRYAPVLGLSTFIFTMARSLDTIMLGYFAPLADVGRYAIVLMVGQLVALIGIALGQTLGTSVAAAAKQGDFGRVADILHDNMSMASLLCAPLCVAIAIWGRDIDLLLGPSYRIPAAVFVVAAGTQWLVTVTHYSSAALSMTGRHMTELANNLFALVVQVLACLVLISQFGLLGAALSTLVTMLSINVARQIQITKLLGRPLFEFRFLVPLLLSAAVAVPIALFYETFDWRAWWLTGLFAGTHVVVSFAVLIAFVMPREQRDRLLRLFRAGKRPAASQG